MSPELAAKLRALPPGKLTEMYLIVRNARDRLRAAEAIETAKLEVLGALLLEKMAVLGQDGFRAMGSTVYRSERVTAQINDRTAFLDFLKQSGRLELLDPRASKEACSLYANEQGELPPGVHLNTIVKVGVRKGS